MTAADPGDSQSQHRQAVPSNHQRRQPQIEQGFSRSIASYPMIRTGRMIENYCKSNAANDVRAGAIQSKRIFARGVLLRDEQTLEVWVPAESCRTITPASSAHWATGFGPTGPNVD